MRQFLLLLGVCSLPFVKSFCLSPNDLSLEQKIGQLMIVHFHGKEANEESEALLKQAHVGGFIYYNWSNYLESFEQVRNLSLSLQKMNMRFSALPLFLSTDQEGGRVSRLQIGFSQFPSSRVIANLAIPALAYEIAKAQAKELKAAGLNTNFAPVVDVDSNPKNSLIGDRAFSKDPEKVIVFARQALRGYKEQNVLASLKHFPGHGDVSVDSHSGTPLVDKSIELLTKIEWAPFISLSPDADAIMTAHVLFSQVDPHKLASVSSVLITDLLRNKWGFQGLVISDSLVMKGITSVEGSVEKAALSALQAGTDVLCFGGKLLNEVSQEELKVEDILRIHAFLVSAVTSGELSEKLVDEKIERILLAKERYCSRNVKESFLLSDSEKKENILLQKEIELLTQINSCPPSLCEKIATKIWDNETGSSLDKLMYWNPNEDFLSLGIGHFIWYPENKQTSFEEGFPSYLAYLRNEKVEIPSWLTSASRCPWDSRQDFLKAKQSPQAKELAHWLAHTMDLQGKFLIHRLPIALHHVFAAVTNLTEKQNMIQTVKQLAETPSGLYALVDYVNFKGSGLSTSERYNSQGWGLFQVLQKISQSDKPVSAADFGKAAAYLLEKRVENAPDTEKEKKWLKGWLNRVGSYSHF